MLPLSCSSDISVPRSWPNGLGRWDDLSGLFHDPIFSSDKDGPSDVTLLGKMRCFDHSMVVGGSDGDAVYGLVLDEIEQLVEVLDGRGLRKRRVREGKKPILKQTV